jgi:hypothetical protein
MNVCVRIQFRSPREEEWASLRSLARGLTNDTDGVRVFADTSPDWLVVEFTMPTEAQYKALPKIEHAIRSWADNQLDSTIAFPISAAERASADRKANRRRTRKHAADQARNKAET